MKTIKLRVPEDGSLNVSLPSQPSLKDIETSKRYLRTLASKGYDISDYKMPDGKYRKLSPEDVLNIKFNMDVSNKLDKKLNAHYSKYNDYVKSHVNKPTRSFVQLDFDALENIAQQRDNAVDEAVNEIENIPAEQGASYEHILGTLQKGFSADELYGAIQHDVSLDGKKNVPSGRTEMSITYNSIFEHYAQEMIKMFEEHGDKYYEHCDKILSRFDNLMEQIQYVFYDFWRREDFYTDVADLLDELLLGDFEDE